jgi:hypothetical protein
MDANMQMRDRQSKFKDKIKQLGEEQLLLMQRIQITSEQQDGYTT